MARVNGAPLPALSAVGLADSTQSGGMEKAEVDRVEKHDTASLELNNSAPETGGRCEEHPENPIIDLGAMCEHESKKSPDNASLETEDHQESEASDVSSREDSALDGSMISSTTSDELVRSGTVASSDVDMLSDPGSSNSTTKSINQEQPHSNDEYVFFKNFSSNQFLLSLNASSIIAMYCFVLRRKTPSWSGSDLIDVRAKYSLLRA